MGEFNKPSDKAFMWALYFVIFVLGWRVSLAILVALVVLGIGQVITWAI